MFDTGGTAREVRRAARRVHAGADEAKQRIAAYVARHGLKRSRQRDAVVAALLASRGHVTAEELTDVVHRDHPSVGLTTVYRTLKLLVSCGVAAAQRFDGHTRYERAVGRAHHDHLVCTSCGAIAEFEDEEIEWLQAEVARRHGFEITSHRMELHGTCARCTGARRRHRPSGG